MARRKRTSKYGKAVTGGKHRTIWNSRENVYEKLKKKYGVKKAARIANAGKTKAQRSAMARKAARTRKRRGR
jgi:hypothetical protein